MTQYKPFYRLNVIISDPYSIQEVPSQIPLPSSGTAGKGNKSVSIMGSHSPSRGKDPKKII